MVRHNPSSMFFAPLHFQKALNSFSVAKSTVKWPAFFLIIILMLGIYRPSSLLPPAVLVRFGNIRTTSMAFKCFLHCSLPLCPFYRLIKPDYCWHILTPVANLRLNHVPVTHVIGAYKRLVPHRKTLCYSSSFVLTCVLTSSIQPVVPVWHLIRQPSMFLRVLEKYTSKYTFLLVLTIYEPIIISPLSFVSSV